MTEVDEKPSDHQKKKAMTTKSDQELADSVKWPDELGSGPMPRRITDICCLILFVISMIAFVAAVVYGFQEGNPKNLFIGWDSDRNACGLNGTFADYPYTYWPVPPNADCLQELKNGNFNKFKQLLNQAVCVQSCPTQSSDIKCMPPSWMTANSDKYDVQKCEAKWQGGVFRYDTVTVADSFCLPNGATYVNKDTYDTIIKAFQSNMYGQTASRWIMNIAKAWQVLVVALITALVIGYLYLFVIRMIGGLIIWVSFAIIVASLTLGGCWTYFMKRKDYLPETNEVYQYLTWGSYALWGLAALCTLLMLCCINAIKIGIAVFKTTTQYIQANMHIFLLPAWGYFTCCVWFILWVAGSVYVFSTGTPAPRATLPFLTEIMWTDVTRYVFFYQVFMLFWINAFLMGCIEFIIGCSAILWYFECTTDTKGRGTVWKGFKWLYQYHVGSIAFGAFVIAVCNMIRFLFEYYRKKIEAADPTKSKLVKFLLCATGYLLYIMNKCVKYITKTAYVQVALTADGFCKAALNSFALMIKNANRFGAGLSIGTVFNVFGVGCIMALNGGACYLFMVQYPQMVDVDDPIAPTVAVCVISGVIGTMFLSIFSFATDAIMQAFLLDEELRFTGNARPEYMVQFADALKSRGQGSCEWQCC